jgi:galactokinase
MQNLTTKFQELFNETKELHCFFSPGRVNLIGEHIDYLGGQVLPTAISLGITGLCTPNSTNSIRIYSTDFNEMVQLDLNNLPPEKQGNWGDFILGTILHLMEKGVPIEGSDILISSSLPKASGLSSSAALEVLTYYMFYQLGTGNEPDRQQMALDCQRIENQFIGVKCGIMDQFAVANGKKNHAILLDCSTLKNNLVPVKLEGYTLLIVNSNKTRTLTESAYNERRSECSQALDIINQTKPIDHLVFATESDLNLLTNPTLRKRAKHASTEQLRVIASELLLHNQDLKNFGKLMTQSHISLRDDFEVSCAELDFIVHHLLEDYTCLGARLTGAGFGGCCIALVSSSSTDRMTRRISRAYRDQFGYAPSFHECHTSDGVHQFAL